MFNQTTNSLSVGFAVSMSDNRIRPSEESFESHPGRVLHTTCLELAAIQGSLYLIKVEPDPMSRLLILASQDLLGGLHA